MVFRKNLEKVNIVGNLKFDLRFECFNTPIERSSLSSLGTLCNKTSDSFIKVHL